MSQVAIPAIAAGERLTAVPSVPAHYPHSTQFHVELKRRVEEYFHSTGKSSRDLPMMYIKTGIILSWYAASYGMLVFHRNTWLESVLYAISLGLAMVGVGFNVSHDANHGAYSARPFINRALSFTLDMLGGSSYIWRWKHNFYHHHFPNVAGADDDIDFGFVGKLEPQSPRRGLQKYQHLYLWLLYGTLSFSWQYYDFTRLIRGRVGPQRIPHAKGWDLATVLAGKILYFSLMFVIPLMFLPVSRVLVNYLVSAFTLGWTMAMVFQLAHCVEEAKFPEPHGNAQQMEYEWAVHQVETTVDFARKNPVVTWYLGGLNYQVEHHLFPKICHLHYPALSPIVEKICAQYGIRYSAHRRLRDALASHYHFLRRSHTQQAITA
jgi:linoleoyl-CoA desaturase